jgi:GntR family transcriptional regulator
MKESKSKPFDLKINLKSAVPIYEQIKGAVRLAVLSKRLVENDKLVSVRHLANRHKINPLTILKAYNQLETEGILYSKRGSGFFVKPRMQISSDEKEELFNQMLGDFLQAVSHLGYTAEEVIDKLQTHGGTNP